MTQTEREEFFAAVQGKRIRWTGCDDRMWFKPEQLDDKVTNQMLGESDYSKQAYYFIENGFEPVESGSRWQFVDTADQAEYERGLAAKAKPTQLSDEQAAAEYTSKWADLPRGEITHKIYGQQAFLAGCAYKEKELKCTCSPCPIHGARIEKAFSNGKGVAT